MDLLSQVMRLPYVKGLWARLPVGRVDLKVQYGIYPRPHYAYGVYWAAYLASCIGVPRITAIELGVAGGRGLVALEAACAEIGTFLGVKIDVVGFDGGEGLPPPVDYRDLPHVWNAGYYKMDQAALRAKLQSAKLVIGDVAVTVKHWLRDSIESPLGFVSFDLDYYSSTKAALALLDGPESTHLPRVHCYFDDLAAGDQSCMNRYVGEYLAIDEFNAAHRDRKICLIEQLRINRPSYEHWQERMYVFHNFSHAKYTQVVVRGARHTEMPL